MSGHLNASHAVLFTPNAGDLSGQTFMIVDANNNGVYNAGADFVFRLSGATGTLAVCSFKT